MPSRPSLQLGLLHGALENAGIAVVSRSFYVDFLHFVMQASKRCGRDFSVDDYEDIAAHHYVGEWIFAGASFDEPGPENESYLAYLQAAGTPARLIEAAREGRRWASAFLDVCAESLLKLRPNAVGFTTTFGQTIASLGVARRIKARSPEISIVFGGANCDGPMGRALMREFSCIDVVVQGEGENSAVAVFSDLVAAKAVRRSPSVLSRSEPGVEVDVDERAVAMDDVPIPNYNEYFDTLARCDLVAKIKPSLALPIEMSRGCWWGMKSHCTFCGLNGTSMRFRSKSAARAESELLALAKRHKATKFVAVDNILDLSYFKTLLPMMAKRRLDIELFYEVKANLSKPQVSALRSAGVTEIQPGLESLSTPILRLMKKGTSAVQNIRLLKWCAEFGIRVHWNIIFGFPGEDETEYGRMADLVQSIIHLEPPSLIKLGLERFSPYHNAPEEHGLRIKGPSAFYRFAYPCGDDALRDLAYSFDYEYCDGRDPVAYTGDLRAAVKDWQERWSTAASRPALTYRRGPEFIEICDRRSQAAPCDIVLEEREAAIYLACDKGASISQLQARLKALGPDYSCGPGPLEAFVDDLASQRLLFRDGNVYLSLACATSVERADSSDRRVA